MTIFRPQAGSDFISSIRPSLPLSGGERSREPTSQTKGGGDGKRAGLNANGGPGWTWLMQLNGTTNKQCYRSLLLFTVLSSRLILYILKACMLYVRHVTQAWATWALLGRVVLFLLCIVFNVYLNLKRLQQMFLLFCNCWMQPTVDLNIMKCYVLFTLLSQRVA